MILILAPLHVEAEALRTHGIDCRIGGTGPKFADGVAHFKQLLKPSLIVAVGGCGALSDELQLLDLVVAGNATVNLRGQEWPFPVKFLDLVCAKQEVVSSDVRDAIREQTGASAVVLENGAAGAGDTPYLEIRVVTDACDEHARESFEANIASGMERIAQVLKRIQADPA